MLSQGDKAPDFKGIDQDGNKISLKDFKGKKVVLYFYPRDMTPTCTVQACNLRDHFGSLQNEGITVVGVSTDDEKKHQRFIAKNELPFPLIADVDHSIHEAYGVWQLKKFMGKEFMGTVRTTFLINESGKIEHIINKPKSKTHAEEILNLWSN